MTSTRTTAALTAVLALAAACWVIAVRQMSGMDMGVGTELGSFGFFVAAWVPMMAAMMLPGAVPAVLRRVRANGWVRAVPLFAASYVAVWALVGLVVYGVYQPHGVAVAGALGVMNVAWMAAVAGLVLVQKLIPPRASIDVPVALAIVALGIVIAI
jgi:predicted metal-binding membrane protein